MAEYTEAVHAERLLKMLERKNPCSLCPGCKHYRTMKPFIGRSSILEGRDDICFVCLEFVGLGILDDCPCDALGHKESIKRTWIALEDKGYI